MEACGPGGVLHQAGALAAVTPTAHLHLSHLLKAYSPPARRLLWLGGGRKREGTLPIPEGNFKINALQTQQQANYTVKEISGMYVIN